MMRPMKPHFSIKSCRVIFSILFLIFFEMLVGSRAFGADEEQDVVNYSYISELGLGEADTDNRTVKAVQIPFSYQLRPMKEEQWGIKLLFPVTFGVLGLDVVDIIGNVISLDASVLSIVPGVELQIPVRKDWVLKPFGKAGGGRDVSGGENAFIYAAGLKSSYFIPWKDFTFTLGNEVSFDGYVPDGGEREDYASVAIGWDTRYPLWFTLKGAETNIGGWLSYYYYFDELVFERPQTAPLAIGQEFEIALAFGTYEKIPIWFMKFDRIGLAYRFSDELKALRLVFEFPF